MCPGRRRSKPVPRCGAVCVRIPGSYGVRQRARWFHRTRPWRGAPSAHACCRPSIPRPCASTETGYPHGVRVSGNARGKWSSSASGFWRQRARCVPFECVAQGCARRQPGPAVQRHRPLRNRKRALHNTQLCSNRPVTEAGLARPRELPGCMSALLCQHAGGFRNGLVWSRWDAQFRHCVPHPRERRSREPVKTLFHFPRRGCGRQCAHGSIGCVQAVTWSRTRIAGRVSAR